MTWTKAETTVLAKLVAALVSSGMVDATSSVAKAGDTVFTRDFLDNKTLQKGKSFAVYSPLAESWNEPADNKKVYRTVSVSVWIATTSSPKSASTIELRERFEEKVEESGFRLRFLQSGFDDSNKLYVFEYKAEMEIGDD